jgi:hypothetical protein
LTPCAGPEQTDCGPTRFNPVSPADLALFRAALTGQNSLTGFRNRHITDQLYKKRPASPDEARRRCKRTSRLIAKVPRSRLYRVTPYGHRVMTAAIAVHDHNYTLNYLAAA